MGIRAFTASLLLFLTSLLASGQDAFSRHTVLPGETVYSIAKRYNISAEELIKYNPDAAATLREGTILIIPKADKPSANQEFGTHTVQAQETLFGLSKQYNCSIDQLLALNPELRDGLKVDMVIKVPVVNTTAQANPEDSSKYTYHVVEPKETVYSICRAAAISEDEFLRINPEVREKGLQIGQTIRLPKGEKKVKQPREDVPRDIVQPQAKMFDLYRVEEGNTLASLAKRFQCTEEELLSLNPELQNGLRAGRYIVIPLHNKPKRTATLKKTNLFWAMPKGDIHPKMRVAVLLPLYLTINDSLANQDPPVDAPVYEKSKIALQFLSGIRLAMDTLAKRGYQIQLDVFDTENNMDKVAQIATKIHPQTDLIIGPLYAKNAEKLARLIPDKLIISPLSKAVNNKGLPNLVDGVNYLDGEYRAMAQWINNHVGDRNIVFLNTDTVFNRKPVQLINRNLYAADSASLQYVWVDQQFSQLAQLDNFLQPERPTTFVVVDQNAAFLSDLLRKLNKRKDSTVSLLATSKIFDIPALENKYLNALNFTATNIDYVNVADTITQHFIAKYRVLTGTEPTRFAYYGFDTGLYFTQLIATFGTLPDSKDWPRCKGLYKGFSFIAETDKGPVNTFTFLLGVKDFTIVEREQ